ncbi:ABC transporter substrate-binding protein [Virgibacillus siamensis]|uniref:ABC transporter substrate-binding protein n=1 Tax=Virgibacillus siamensis TaxID=480071 RepID=UPI000985F6E7|nr:sugar ABC transporter substrate-binding protein [Virgibacillus siamensis]
MRNKYVFSLIGILMAAMVITGCSSSESSSDSGEITLTYWGAGHITQDSQTMGEWDKMMAKKFEEKHPNVNIEFQRVGGADFTKKVNTAIAAENPPDIIGTNAPLRIMQYARNGLLEPLGEKVLGDRSDWNEDILKNGMYNDELYAITTVVGPQVLVVNKKIFKEAGKLDLLPKDHDWTWAEFEKASKQVIGDGIYGTAFWAKNEQVNQNNLNYLMSFGAEWANDDFSKYLINSEEGVKALENMVRLVDEGIVAPGPANSDYKSGFKLWKQGRLIAYWAAPGEMFNVDNSKFDPYPIVPLHAKGVDPGVPVTGEQGIAIFKQEDPEKEKWAKKYLKFITSSEAIKKTAKGWLYLPARKSSEYTMNGEKYKAFNKYLELYSSLEKEQTGKFVPWFPELRKSIFPNLQAAYLHEKSPQEALDTIADKGNSLAEEQKNK